MALLASRRPSLISSFLPTTAYRYRPLEQDHIRLLRLLPPAHWERPVDTSTIQCELVHVHLAQAGEYEALSYFWGSPERTETIRIKVGELQLQPSVLHVTESLYIALRNLRYASETRVLWIDQLSIKQDDTAEKNAQVRRMGEIYSKARCTVVWLGPRGYDAELLEDMYSRLSILQSNTQDSGGVLMLDHDILTRIIGTSNEEEKHNEMVQKRRLLLERFLDLPWFRRAWVYQEAVIALRVNMVWGDIVLPLDFVTGLVVSAYSIGKSAEDGRWHKRIKKTRGFAPVRTIYHDRKAHRRRELNFLRSMACAEAP